MEGKETQKFEYLLNQWIMLQNFVNKVR